MQALQQYFISSGFSETDANIILDYFVEKHYPKGSFFAEEGRTGRYLGFVGQGLLQYYVLVDGEEKTTYTAGEYSFVASLQSFLKQVPAKENIRAAVDTVVWVIERPALLELQQTIPAFKDFYIQILEWQICCIDESRLDGLMLNARQRYEKMLEKEPNLIQRIPLQYLASILGVTARHLSRIRGGIR